MTDSLKEPQGSSRQSKMVIFEKLVLSTRWLQLPLIVGLIAALVIFEFKFVEHLWLTVTGTDELTRIQAILVTLDLIDMVLIANLVVMVVISGYKIFISPLRVDESAVPSWMRGSTPGELKLRIATTVLLISTIHLLHLYLDPTEVTEGEANFMLLAQLVFAITTGVFLLVEHFERGRG